MSCARNRNAATSAHPLCRESITLRNCFSTSVRSWWAFRWIRAERSLFAKEKAASKCALCAQHESTTAMQEATSSITNERSKSRFLGIARFCTDREILALHERKTFALQWRFLWHHFHGNAPAGKKIHNQCDPVDMQPLAVGKAIPWQSKPQLSCEPSQSLPLSSAKPSHCSTPALRPCRTMQPNSNTKQSHMSPWLCRWW